MHLHTLIEALGGWIQTVIASGGYFAVAGLMAIESACIPLPSEVIMPFAGSLVALGRFGLWQAALAGAMGCVLGSIPAYYLGQFGGRPLIERYGRYVLVSSHDLDLADRLFAKYGERIVFAARLLPVIRTFIAFPAGVARMDMGRFLAYTFAGSLPWCLGLAFVGQKLGQHWEALKPIFHASDGVIAVIGVTAVGLWIWRHLRQAQSVRAGLPPA
ncbi:MAG: DedA family protein [Deltaproteobacteria bacterium]